MCTALVDVDPGAAVPVLLAGVRDEFAARPWSGPGHHWPDRPGLVGGIDLQAGGTWLAVDTATPRVACVLNGHGPLAPEEVRRSRGELPLLLAADGKLDGVALERYDPFHLLCAEPEGVRLSSWDGEELVEHTLGPGLHIVVNSGLEGKGGRHSGPGMAEMAARIGYFRPRLAQAVRPEPKEDGSTAEAWAEWLPIVDGDGLERSDPRALVLRREFAEGVVWGTGSISLVALRPGALRYDFSARPGDPAAWTRVIPA